MTNSQEHIDCWSFLLYYMDYRNDHWSVDDKNGQQKSLFKRQLRFKDLAEISDRNEERKRKNVRKMDNKT